MAFKRIKAYLRRRRLAACSIAPELDLPTVSFGARSGVWTIHGRALGPGSIVYSFGVGDNIAWDLELIRRFGVHVHAFDPTPRSIEWIVRQSLPPQFHFHAFGLGCFDGELELYPPRKPHKINFTAWPGESSSVPTVRCPVKRLTTILRELGHARLDVLKMDIEGAEMSALPDVLESGIPIGQLLVEFHDNHPGIAFDQVVDLIRRIRSRGFRILHVSPRGREFSFLNPDFPAQV